jgi:hypothetical protein
MGYGGLLCHVGQGLHQARESSTWGSWCPGSEHGRRGHNKRGAGIGDGAAIRS